MTEDEQLSNSAPIRAIWKADIETSITIKDIGGKIDKLRSGNIAGEITRVESEQIPLLTCYGGNPQMIRVGVEVIEPEDVSNTAMTVSIYKKFTKQYTV